MKTSFDNSEIFHVWAHQKQASGYGSHTSFNDTTAYSYNTAVAKLFPDRKTALVSKYRYSNTTSRHVGEIRSAVSHLSVIDCFYIPRDKKDSGTHENNIALWFNQIKDIAAKIKTARKPASYVAEIHGLKEELTEYCQFFNLKLAAEQKKILSITDAQGFLDLLDKEQKQRELAAKKIDKEGSKIHAKWVENWRNFGNGQAFYESLTKREHELYTQYKRQNSLAIAHLRADENGVYTSKNITLNNKEAKAAYLWVKKTLAAGGCVGNCDMHIQGYRVNKLTPENLVIGCHTIPLTEIDYIAKLKGWA